MYVPWPCIALPLVLTKNLYSPAYLSEYRIPNIDPNLYHLLWFALGCLLYRNSE